MFSRPFSDFDPGPAELQAGASVRTLIVDRVQRCIDAGAIEGDTTDIAHGLVALIQGLAEAEISKRLGTTRASVDRRWELAIGAMLAGLRPEAIRPARPAAVGHARATAAAELNHASGPRPEAPAGLHSVKRAGGPQRGPDSHLSGGAMPTVHTHYVTYNRKGGRRLHAGTRHRRHRDPARKRASEAGEHVRGVGPTRRSNGPTKTANTPPISPSGRSSAPDGGASVTTEQSLDVTVGSSEIQAAAWYLPAGGNGNGGPPSTSTPSTSTKGASSTRTSSP